MRYIWGVIAAIVLVAGGHAAADGIAPAVVAGEVAPVVTAMAGEPPVVPLEVEVLEVAPAPVDVAPVPAGPVNPIDPTVTAQNMSVPTDADGRVVFDPPAGDGFDADIAACERTYAADPDGLSDCINQSIVFHGMYE